MTPGWVTKNAENPIKIPSESKGMQVLKLAQLVGRPLLAIPVASSYQRCNQMVLPAPLLTLA